MKHSMSTNPTAATVKRCIKCGNNFSVAVNRDLCLNCKPLTKAEYNKLMNYNGGHVVLNKGLVTSLIK